MSIVAVRLPFLGQDRSPREQTRDSTVKSLPQPQFFPSLLFQAHLLSLRRQDCKLPGVGWLTERS